MTDIQEKIKCVVGCVFSLIVILIVCSIVYLGCNKNSNPIINSLTLIGSYVGAIATLAAAYIASLLFNDWRVQHDKIIEKELLVKIINDYENFHYEYCEIFDPNSTLTPEYVESNLDRILIQLQMLSNKIRLIHRAYNNYNLFVGNPTIEEKNEIFYEVRRSIFYLNQEKNPVEKNKLIRARVIEKLNEFNEKYQEDIYPDLFLGLKACR